MGLAAFLIGGGGVAVVAIVLTPLLAAIAPAVRASIEADLRFVGNANLGRARLRS